MNATRTMMSLAGLTLAGLMLGMSADQAQAQCYTTYTSYGPYSYAPPAVYAPAPAVIVAPAPVIVRPAPVYHTTRTVYRAPVRRTVSFGYVSHGRGHRSYSGHHRTNRSHHRSHRSHGRGISFGFSFSH